jgi:hypothetical protein
MTRESHVLMTDAITKLREPAALGAAAFAALMTLAAVISLLFTSGPSFSAIAYSETGSLLSFEVAAGIAIAVYLANHVGPALPKARLVTLVALVTAAAAALFGLVSFFAGFGAQGASGTAKFTYFLAGAGGAVVLGLAGWYTWLTWQTHAPARPAAPAAPAPGGWAPQQGQGPQGGAAPQQPGPGQQGYGWKPGNAAEQTAYLPPQGGSNGPQTLQAQQSATGSYAVPPGGAHAGPQQGGQGGGERTQMIPPVPPTMQDYAPDPQPWQPGGAQQGGVPQPPPTRPMNPGEGQDPEGPFGVGNWQ